MRTETVEHNRRVDDRVFEAVASPYDTLAPPKKKDVVPAFDFAPLNNAVARLQVAGRRFGAASGAALRADANAPAADAGAGQRVLLRSERALIRTEGLPRRPWFRHQVYAPGFYTGYGVKTLPAVREAIEQRAWDEARAQIPLVAQTLERYAAEVERAAALLEVR